MASLLVDVVNGLSAIHLEVQSIMTSDPAVYHNLAAVNWSQNLLMKIFGDHRRVSDGILAYYLQHHRDSDIYACAGHISCIFTALCLCDSDDFIRFLFDIYAEPTNPRYISMTNLGLLLRTIFESVGGNKVVEESLNSMSLYASVVANRIDEGMYKQDEKIFIQKNIPTQFYTRKHKHGLWPLEVLQHQIKEKFLGTEFWERIRKANLASLNLSSSLAGSFQEYLEIIALILKDAPEVKKKQLSENNAIPSDLINEDGAQVVQDDGVYTLKTSTPVGSHASTLLRRPLNRKPSLRCTDFDEGLSGIDCPFVSENDIALIKHPRTPSPEPLNRSSHGSRPTSRQNSPLSSKSSSFSFDMVDMGESPVSNTNSGIATRGGQPITPTNLLRNRSSNYKLPPRLGTGNLPPLSNHSSRSTSPSFMNTSPGTSTSSNEIPLDAPTEGGLSDIVLEATFLMKGLKILIIEDSTVQRKLMTKKLHSTGKRPSIDKRPSYEQVDVNLTPSNLLCSPNLGTQPGIFNFADITLTTTPSPALVAAGLVHRSTTPNDMVLTTDSIGEFPSASQSPAGISHHSPSTILTSNQSNDIPLTPTNGMMSMSNQEREDGGWQVSEAVNGEEAIQRLITTKETFDIIFVDENLQSSGGNLLGHEVVKILRGHHSVPSSTIIIGCSSTAEQNALLFLEAGANAVWKKPMPSDEKIRTEICKYLAAV